ncbi:MAG: twin-arginine translocase subunit TatB [Chloroflexi bacterium]|uniref:Sec-independent protein translocase protein TatB homolog n=1 Tax=Candidatus Chlorohelix allophototropha TaxID=3003348 RepID=A0A8T7M961_9CHLR|nr:twin-arginine translocase subunit TatB [Chloroflexota bacterium]WJW68511.1 Sec-independent protein translocase protein TatB [Chloroflexota bacterium L227-S17]
MDIFGINFPELFVILIVATIIFGPDKLPVILRTIGQWVAQLRKLSEDVRTEVSRELDISDFKDIKKDLKEAMDNTTKELTSASTTFRETVKEAREQYTYSVETIATAAKSATSNTPLIEAPAVEPAQNQVAAEPDNSELIKQVVEESHSQPEPVSENNYAYSEPVIEEKQNYLEPVSPEPVASSAPMGVYEFDEATFSWQDALMSNAPAKPLWRGPKELNPENNQAEIAATARSASHQEV